jgi:DNA polymerase I
MQLLPWWDKRLAESSAPKPEVTRTLCAFPRLPEYYAEKTTFVNNEEAAHAMGELAQQRPLTFVGIATQYRHKRSPGDLENGRVWIDPKGIEPLLVALHFVETGNQGQRSYRFVCDLRQPCVVQSLAAILRLPVVFVGHGLNDLLFALWQLGLRAPDQLWDARICERALELGKHRPDPVGAEVQPDIRAKLQGEEDQEARLSLSQLCLRYGVDNPRGLETDRMQRVFQNHPADASFTADQIDYAASQAEVAARLYLPQVQAATLGGVLNHLLTVEMPWVETNARMIWNGVRVDKEKRARAIQACRDNLPALTAQLGELGLDNPHSNQQLQEFFGRRGLLDAFRRKGGYSFDKDQMKRVMHLDTSIPLIRSARRLQDFQADAITRDELIGLEGRFHPVHQQLGADTGRQTCRWPNVLGLDRVLRPMIVPEPGRAIGEVDLSQIEVGIAAAVYGDKRLVEMFNTGDVYSAMAQRFYADQLTDQDRNLPSREFKATHPDLRNRMKTCTLGIIYGLTPHGLSIYLSTTEPEARKLQEQFMAMFPQLEQGLRDAATFGGMRGYAVTSSGLRRYRTERSQPSSYERNWLTNHPVQGSAAVVFKAAGNRLNRSYERYDAWLIIPFHDAFIFETPTESLQGVAQLTADVMCQTVQEYFPMLRPRVEINISRPDCWNKDGNAAAFENWLEDPLCTI